MFAEQMVPPETLTPGEPCPACGEPLVEACPASDLQAAQERIEQLEGALGYFVSAVINVDAKLDRDYGLAEAGRWVSRALNPKGQTDAD
jgi:hypothetical protein